MPSQIHHVDCGANPLRRRDVDDIGILAYQGKDSKWVGARSMKLRRNTRSITLGP